MDCGLSERPQLSYVQGILVKCKGWEWKKGNHITQGNFSSSTSEALLADSDFVLYDKLFDQHYDVENQTWKNIVVQLLMSF